MSNLQSVLTFDGVDDYISVPDHPSLQISSYTVEVWVKPNGKPSEEWKGIVGKPGRNYHIWMNNTGYVHHRFHTNKSTNAGAPNTPNGSFKWDRWSHVAITNDGTTAKTYINGDLQAEGPTGGTLVVDKTPLYVARTLDEANGRHFKGQIADLRIWNQVRSPEEIKNCMGQRLNGHEPGLVAYWPLDEGSGTTAGDKTSNGNQGTIYGATWTQENLEFITPAPTDRQIPQSVASFNGSNQYIEVPYKPELNPAQFTLSCWAKVEGGQGTWRSPVTCRTAKGSKALGGYLLYAGNNNKWQFWTGNGGWVGLHGADVVLNTWTHVAATYDGSTMKLYINGELSGKPVQSKILINSQHPLRIGAGITEGNPGFFFNGKIAEVRLWDKARSPEEIQESMHQRLKGDEPGLVAYWPLDQESGTSAEDKTGKGNPGTLNGATWTQENIDFIQPSAPETEQTSEQSVLMFNGRNNYVQIPISEWEASAFSVELWAKASKAQPGYASVISNANNTQKGSFQIDVGGGYYRLLHSVQVQIGKLEQEWQHLAVTYDGATVKTYLNGEEQNTKAIDSMSTVFKLYKLGRNRSNNTYFAGQLSEVRIWDRARTAEEIQGAMGDRLVGDEPGLVAYFPLNEGEGRTVKDQTTQDHEGTIHGATWTTSELPLTSQKSSSKESTEAETEQASDLSSLMFDGVDDHIATTLDAQPSALPNTTWEAWVKPTRNINHWDMILSTDDGGWDRFVGVNGGQFRVSHGKEAWNPVNADINQWQHIAVVYSADKQIKFYKNGTEYVYSGQSTIGSTKLPFHIGRSAGNTSQCFQGFITEVRVWDSARTAADIQNHMHRRLTGNEPGLVGYWPLNEGQGTTGADQSHHGYDSTINGATWETSALPLTPPEKTDSEPSALMFDGVDDYVSLPIESIPEGKEITISFWAKGGSSLPKQCSVFFAYPTPNFNPSKGKIVYTVNIHLPWSNSNIYFDCGSDGNTYNRIYKAAQATDFKDKWTHWAFTLNANTGKMAIYLNGDSWCEGSNKTLSIPKAGEVKLGSGYGFYHGSLSDVRVWDRELSGTEIKDTMSTRLTGTEPGLVSYWPLDEGTGTTVTDKSGNNHNGTIQGATWETSGLDLSPAPTVEPSETPSTQTTILTFDGVDDYVDIPTNPTLDLTDNFTIEAWIKPEVLGKRIVDKNIGGKSEGFTFDTYPQNLRFINKGIAFTSQTPLTTGTWQHVAVTFKNEANGAKLYINGEVDNTATPSRVGTVTKLPVRLGSQADALGNLFKGEMAEVRMWNRVRTPEEIKASMNQRLAGDEEGLIGYWPLNEGTGTTAEDITSNGNTGTVHGGTWGTSDLSLTPAPEPETTVEETEEPSEPEATAEETEEPSEPETTAEETEEPSEPETTSEETEEPSEPETTAEEQSSEQSVLMFDGENDYIATTLDTQPSALPATTWEAWVKPTRNINHWDMIFSTDDGGWDRFVGTNGGQFRVSHGQGAWNPVDADINQWQHIAVVYSADKQIKFYKNGTEYIYSGIYSGQSTMGSTKLPFHIGCSASNASQCFQGFITEVRVWDSARTAAEIQNDMHCRLMGNEPGLVGYWPLNEGQGTTGTDRSNQGHDGTINGATWESSGLQLSPAPTMALSPASLMFDGIDDSVAIPNAEWETSAFSVELWAKASQKQSNYAGLLSSSNDPTETASCQIDAMGGFYRFYHDDIQVRIAKANQEWQHLVVTYDGTAVQTYLNGEPQNSKAIDAMNTVFKDYVLGRNRNGDKYFAGELSDVRIWDRALTADEIQEAMDYRLTGDEPGLVAYWPLDEGKGDAIADRTGNTQPGVINGATWQTTDLELSVADEDTDASPDIPQEPESASKKGVPLDKSVTSITVLKSDEDFGGRPDTLYGKSSKSKKGKKKGKKKRKKHSKFLSPYEKYVRELAKRQDEATHTYVERHKRSNRKKKDGWLKDFVKNYSKSVSKLF